MSRCVIIGAGPIKDPEWIKNTLYKSDFIICADGGLNAAIKANIKPDLIIGDFDSFTEEPPEDCQVIKLSPRKNDTDLMCAVKEAIRRGFKNFVILGAIGGRLDHTFANLSVLNYIASNGLSGVLLDEKNEATIATLGTVKITGEKGATVSIFPFAAKSCLVSYDGLEYPISNTRLYSDCTQGPMGVSNILTMGEARVIIHEGPILIVISRD